MAEAVARFYDPSAWPSRALLRLTSCFLARFATRLPALFSTLAELSESRQRLGRTWKQRSRLVNGRVTVDGVPFSYDERHRPARVVGNRDVDRLASHVSEMLKNPTGEPEARRARKR